MTDKLTICCVMLLIIVIPAVRSCNVTSILNEAALQDAWFDRTIRIDAEGGVDDSVCLTNSSRHQCRTLAFVLNYISDVSVTTKCIKLVLSKSSSSSPHIIPYNVPPLLGTSLYFVSEEGEAVITCNNSTANDTVLSIQNAEFVIFKSLHFSNCSRRLEVKNVTTVYFQDVKLSNFSDSGLRLLNNLNVTLQNVNFTSCSSIQQVVHRFPENSALSVVYRNSGQKVSYVKVLNSHFQNNSVELIKRFDFSNSAINGSDFSGRGGGLGLFIIEPLQNKRVEFMIDGCNFTGNTAGAYGGALYLVATGLSSGNNHIISNSVFDDNYAMFGGGGILQTSYKSGNFTLETKFDPSHFYVVKCNFTRNSAEFGGGLSFVIALAKKRTTDTASISDCIFLENNATTLGAAIMISTLTYPHLPEQDNPYNISNCTFKRNSSPSGVLGVTFKDLEFYGTNHFVFNMGPSIRATDSNIAIHGYVDFSHNMAELSDAVILVQDFVQFQMYSGSQMFFRNNTGKGITSAFSIFLHEYPRAFSQLLNNPWCFLLHEDLEKSPFNWDDVNITFDYNKALLAPNMYIGNFQLCSWNDTTPTQVYFDEQDVLNWPVFTYGHTELVPFSVDGNKSLAPPAPLAKSARDKGIRTAAIEITGKKNYTARPGEEFNLELVPNDTFGNPTAFVFGFTQPDHVLSGRIARYVDLSNEQDVANKQFVVDENIVEYVPGQSTLSLLYKLPLDKPSIQNFTIAIYAAVDLDIHDVSISFVHINVEKCLPGFTLRKASANSNGLTCECDYERGSGNIVSCNSDQTVVLRDGLIGIYYDSLIFQPLKVISCPPTYCQCKVAADSTLCTATYNHTNEEQQCHPDRNGTLCGSCRHDHHGVGVLTMHCRNCDSHSLPLLMTLLVLFDIVLVCIILSSATPFPPALHGVLFYIQAMPFAVTSFPLSTWRGNQYMLYISSALSLYFPWDFCLYEGMTALASHFFRYVPSIIALIIISVVLKYRPRGYTSPKGRKFLKIYRRFRSKCVHGTWTLVLLMFMRLLQNAWSISNCTKVTANGLSWYHDGNIQCFSDYRHLLLFLFAILVMLFAAAMIIFIGLLTAGALSDLTKKYATYRRLYESASHPYRERFKWWPCVDMGRRFMLVLFWNVLSTNSVFQVFPFFIIFLVYVYVQPYKKSWHNWLDSFLLAYSVILLLLRSANFITGMLLPNAYTGVMLPNKHPYNRSSSIDPFPSDDALTHFFVPLLYLPLTIGLAIVSYKVFNLLRTGVVGSYYHLHQMYQQSKNKKKLIEVLIPSTKYAVHTNTDSGVYVAHGDGHVTKVQVTYADFI